MENNKIEAIFKITQLSSTKWGRNDTPAQHTHFTNIKPVSIDLPYFNNLHLVLPEKYCSIGDKFKITIEKID